MDDEVRLILFDLDGTLITSYMEDEPKDFHTWAPFPGTAQALDRMRAASIKAGIVTNQAGIGFGYNTVTDWYIKRERVCGLLGFTHDDFFSCFHHPKAEVPFNDAAGCLRRKPAPGMLFEAMEHYGVGPEHTIYVGDMETDAEAARHARIRFLGAGELFDHAVGAESGQLYRVPIHDPRRSSPVPMPTWPSPMQTWPSPDPLPLR